MSNRLSNMKVLSARTLREPRVALKHADTFSMPFGTYAQTVLAKGGIFRMFDKPTGGFYTAPVGQDARDIAAAALTGNTGPWSWGVGSPRPGLGSGPLMPPLSGAGGGGFNFYGSPCQMSGSSVDYQGTIFSWLMGCSSYGGGSGLNMAELRYGGFHEVIDTDPSSYDSLVWGDEAYWGSDRVKGLSEVGGLQFFTGPRTGFGEGIIWFIWAQSGWYLFPLYQIAEFNYTGPLLGSCALMNFPDCLQVEKAWADVRATARKESYQTRLYAIEVAYGSCAQWGTATGNGPEKPDGSRDHGMGAMTVFGADDGTISGAPSGAPWDTSAPTVADVHGPPGETQGPWPTPYPAYSDEAYYNAGDRVWWNGAVHEALVAVHAYNPGDTTQGVKWQRVNWREIDDAPTVMAVLIGITPEGLAEPLGVSAAFAGDGVTRRVDVTDLVNALLANRAGRYRSFGFGLCAGQPTEESGLAAMMGGYSVSKVFTHWPYPPVGHFAPLHWCDGYMYLFDVAQLSNVNLSMGNCYVKTATGDDVVDFLPLFAPPSNLPRM